MEKATTMNGNGKMDFTKVKLDKGSRRNKGTVRFFCLMDVFLSLFLFVFYLIGGLIMNTIVFQVRNGPFSKLALHIISLILWFGVFGITYMQLVSAYRLFLVTFQDALGPQVAVQHSHSWLRTSGLAFGLIIFKIIYLSLRESPVMAFVWVLCIMEIIFRLLALYFVREFCDDLKHQIGLAFRRPHVQNLKQVISEVPTVVISKHSEV